MLKSFILIVLLGYISTLVLVSGCYLPPKHTEQVIKSPRPHEYLKVADFPKTFDWRNATVGDNPPQNYCNRVLTQQVPFTCGNCWAQASTGALSDRYSVATGGLLRVTLAPQMLINFNKEMTGGSCLGGSDYDAYRFMYKYGIVDDTCAPYMGGEFLGTGLFRISNDTVESVHSHACRTCDWDGNCSYKDPAKVNFYGVDEYGLLYTEEERMAEIYARGPIACSIYDHVPEFSFYTGGIIDIIPKGFNFTTHVIVIVGWGATVDPKTGEEIQYWIGRNSFGGQWGEGAGGGMFRLKRGQNTLNFDLFPCAFAVPSKAHVDRAIRQHHESLI